MTVTNFSVCDLPRLTVTDWRLRFLALMTATREFNKRTPFVGRIARLDACNLENTPVEETYLRDIRYRTEECPAVGQMMSTPLPIPAPTPAPAPSSSSPPAATFVSLSFHNSEAKWRAKKKYPAPKPPLRGVCCIAPVPEDADDGKDRTI